MKKVSLLLVAFVVAAPLFAQEMMPAAGPDAVATLKANFDYVKGYIVDSAAEMPEADYAFKPTPEVRSFGQIIGHVADSNYMVCSIVLGKESPSKGVEKNVTSKADLEKALKASYDYCEAAFSMPDKAIGMKLKLFGHENTRLGALVLELTHNWEHYGNLVTYLRIKGLVPPSSRPAKM
jgi:uncharacterized damage-inducible protein DinB